MDWCDGSVSGGSVIGWGFGVGLGDKDLLVWGAFCVGRGSQVVYGASLENWCSLERMGSNPIPGAFLLVMNVWLRIRVFGIQSFLV